MTHKHIYLPCSCSATSWILYQHCWSKPTILFDWTTIFFSSTWAQSTQLISQHICLSIRMKRGKNPFFLSIKNKITILSVYFAYRSKSLQLCVKAMHSIFHMKSICTGHRQHASHVCDSHQNEICVWIMLQTKMRWRKSAERNDNIEIRRARSVCFFASKTEDLLFSSEFGSNEMENVLQSSERECSAHDATEWFS